MIGLLAAAVLALVVKRRAAAVLLAIVALPVPPTCEAGEATPLINLFRDELTTPCRSTWIVSSRKSPQISTCREIFCNATCEQECYRAPVGSLQVFHRQSGGQMCRSNLGAMRAALDPSRPTVIFIHGSFVTLDYFVRQTPRTAAYLECGAGQPLNVIFFTWPSDGCIPACAAAVRSRERRARTNAFYVAELLRLLPPPAPGLPANPTILVSHSHGGEMVSATLHLLAGGHVAGKQLACPPSVRPRAVLFAPAMDSNDFNPGQSFDRALCATPAMALVYSRGDVATKLYPLRRLFSPRALGRTGLTDRNAAAIGPVSTRVHNVDVTNPIGHQHVWGAYLSNPHIVRMVGSYLR